MTCSVSGVLRGCSLGYPAFDPGSHVCSVFRLATSASSGDIWAFWNVRDRRMFSSEVGFCRTFLLLRSLNVEATRRSETSGSSTGVPGVQPKNLSENDNSCWVPAGSYPNTGNPSENLTKILRKPKVPKKFQPPKNVLFDRFFTGCR